MSLSIHPAGQARNKREPSGAEQMYAPPPFRELRADQGRCPQLDMQALHRMQERWVMQRTAIVNQIRSLSLERGITLRQGRHHVGAALPRILCAMAYFFRCVKCRASDPR